MEPYADVNCILRVNTNCGACKCKMVEVISSISGVYSISIDGDENLLKICGEVDPNRLLSALSREGEHAEIVKAHLKHPGLRRNSMYPQGSARGHGYGRSMYGHDASYGHGQLMYGHGHKPHYGHQAYPIRGALPYHANHPFDYHSTNVRSNAYPF
ncbi:unnamed protein product [Cuscuta epithymum]|uniref:HMA domain-containing protein n=2 Tax=Cuscuta epithymum TaxID=186058 RepID=A0AAV0DZX3_9ASTE|nr:unnamed protein product [Cuscuta epithymum]